MKKLIRNAIKTPDGTVLESTHTHDFKSHIDKNGNYYAIDGGLSYLKRIATREDYEELSKWDEDENIIV